MASACIYILAACLLGVPAGGETVAPPPDSRVAEREMPDAAASQVVTEPKSAEGIPALRSEPVPAAYPLANIAAPSREHAPLALFSLGSLAVGGAFYGISSSMHRSNVAYTAGDRSQFSTAVGLAGLTALMAAGAYLYYAHQSAQATESSPDWDAAMTGGFSPQGDLSIGARLTAPLPVLSR